MDTFGFTQKKWQTLSNIRQHRHLIKWLSGFYQKLITSRVSFETLGYFTRQYNQVLSWSALPLFTPPATDTPRDWIEAVSDRIQFHRLQSGMDIKDFHLALNIHTRDSISPKQNIDIDCHIALDGLRSLFNVGAVFRVCDAAGFNSIILGNTPGKADPKIRKTAMGAEQWVETQQTADLFKTLMDKKKAGYRIVGVETVEGAVLYDQMKWQKKTVLVLGNEEYGIASHTLAACDQFVRIPMFGRKNSINVAACAAVICFHITSRLRKDIR